MVNQVCIAGLVQGLAEAIAFGQRAGLDMPLVLDVIGKGAAQSWQMDNRGKTMLDDKFDFGFAVDWMRKDLGLVLEEARRNGAQLPVTALVDQFYAEVQAQGGRRWDTSSLIRGCAASARWLSAALRPARGLGRTAQLGQLLFGQHLEHPHDLLHARDRCGQFRAARRFAFGDTAHQEDHAALGHDLEGIGLQVLGVHKGGLDLGAQQGVVGTRAQRAVRAPRPTR
jgi:hypothetical protein